MRDKYIRSIAKDPEISYFAKWDYEHLRNKFPNAKKFLVRRLSIANTRRRQQLRHWEKHPDVEQLGDHLIESSQTLPDKKIELKPKAYAESQPQEAQVRPMAVENHAQSLGVLSKTTKQSFSTVACSVLNDNETFSGRPRTVYEPSIQSKHRSLRVPDLPKVVPGVTSFRCPFCLISLEVKTMSQRHLWK